MDLITLYVGSKWREEGKSLRNKRKELEIPMPEMAKEIKVSLKELRAIELGRPLAKREEVLGLYIEFFKTVEECILADQMIEKALNEYCMRNNTVNIDGFFINNRVPILST